MTIIQAATIIALRQLMYSVPKIMSDYLVRKPDYSDLENWLKYKKSP
jgi:hypothetical protein